jgi:hypothetical protein
VKLDRASARTRTESEGVKPAIFIGIPFVGIGLVGIGLVGIGLVGIGLVGIGLAVRCLAAFLLNV